jgi:AAA15 family ATPase/GTPase
LYGFEFSPDAVLGEWLYEIKKTTEKQLFERHTENEQTVVDFGLKLRTKKQKDFLQEFSSGTRPNQLFLTKCYEDNNVTYFNDVAKWFKKLQIIFSGTKDAKWPIQMMVGNGGVIQDIIKYLEAFDTGVCDFSTEAITSEGIIPAYLIDNLKTDNNADLGFFRNHNGQIYIFRKEEDFSINIQKVVFQHRVEGCNDKTGFDMGEESDGTLRIIDLIPLLYSQDSVFLVDELDRSMHPSLSYKLVELFLTNQNTSQLIVTTHEDHLLNLDLLRRDEIWFVEKDLKGSTDLYSLEEFTPRHDKDIQNGYLLGRFGAIPIMGNIDFASVEA